MLFYLGGSLLILLVLVAAIWTVCSKRYASRFNLILVLAAAVVLLAFVVAGHSQWNRQWQLLRLLHTPAASSTHLATEEKVLLQQMDNLPLRMDAIRSEHKQDGSRYHQIIRQGAQTYVVTLQADTSPFFWAPTYTIGSVSQTLDTPAIEAGGSFETIFIKGLHDALGKYNLNSGSTSYEPEQMRMFFAVDVDEPPTQAEAAAMIDALWAQVATLAQYDDADTLLKPYRIEFGFRTGKDDTLYTPGHKDWNSTSILWDRTPDQP